MDPMTSMVLLIATLIASGFLGITIGLIAIATYLLSESKKLYKEGQTKRTAINTAAEELQELHTAVMQNIDTSREAVNTALLGLAERVNEVETKVESMVDAHDLPKLN